MLDSSAENAEFSSGKVMAEAHERAVFRDGGWTVVIRVRPWREAVESLHARPQRAPSGKTFSGQDCASYGRSAAAGAASALALARRARMLPSRSETRRARPGYRRGSVEFWSAAFALRCDVTDEASVRAMMKDAGRELGASTSS